MLGVFLSARVMVLQTHYQLDVGWPSKRIETHGWNFAMKYCRTFVTNVGESDMKVLNAFFNQTRIVLRGMVIGRKRRWFGMCKRLPDRR